MNLGILKKLGKQLTLFSPIRNGKNPIRKREREKANDRRGEGKSPNRKD